MFKILALASSLRVESEPVSNALTQKWRWIVQVSSLTAAIFQWIASHLGFVLGVVSLLTGADITFVV